jgi:hypothetical protein
MGDRTYTTIRFSGAIKRSQVPELIEALEAEGAYSSEYNNGEQRGPSVDNLMEEFCVEECNYAQMETAEAAAGELNLSYVKTWQPGGCYGPGIEIYNALLNETFECPAIDGEPVVGISELLKKPVEEIIPYLQMFADDEKAYPPLEIVEDE